MDVNSLPQYTGPVGSPAGVGGDEPFRLHKSPDHSKVSAPAVKVVTGQLVTPATAAAASSSTGLDPSQMNVYGGFDGVNEATAGGFPPDVQMAKGPTHIVEMTNFAVRIYTLSGQIVSTVSMGSLFGCGSDFCFDPQVFYDQASSRWFASATENGSGLNGTAAAVSATSDPTQGFCVYAVPAGGANPDQTIIATSDDKFMMSTNVYDASNSFIGAQYVILDKTAILSCPGSVGAKFFNPDPSNFSVHPVYNLDGGSDLFAVENLGTNKVREFRFCGAVPGVTICDTVDQSISATTGTPTAPQPGTTFQLNTGDGRVLDASHRMHIIWLTFADGCTPGGDTTTRSCIRLIQLSEPFSCGFLNLFRCISLNVDFDYGFAGFYLFYPALTIDSNGNLGFIFGYDNPTSSTFPSLAAGGRLQIDGSLTAAYQIRAGSSFTTQLDRFGRTRYGDYFAAHPDPNNNNLIYVAGEYMPATNNWGTWINVIRVDTSIDPASTSISLNAIGNVLSGQLITASGTVVDAQDNGMPPGIWGQALVSFAGNGAGSLVSAVSSVTGSFSTFGFAPLPVGSYCVQAVYPGANAFFNPSNSLMQCYQVQNFALSANPAAVHFKPGLSPTSTITAAGLNGFSGTISLAAPTVTQVTGTPCAPNCPVASLSTTSITTGGAVATLTISTTALTPVGTYIITIPGTAGGVTQMASVTLQPPDFTLTATPITPNSIAPGTTSTSIVGLTNLNPFSDTVTVTAKITFHPVSFTGVSVKPGSTTFTLQPMPFGSSYVLKVSATLTATPGSYQITLTAKDTFGTTHTVVLSFTVT